MFELSTSDARPYDGPDSQSHRCLSGPHCRRAETTDGQRVGTTNTKPGTLCDSCHDHYRKAASRLTHDWAMLHATLGERQTSTGDLVKSTPTPAIPLNTATEALMAEIVEVADRAAAIVSDIIQTDQPDGRRKLPKGRNDTGKIVVAPEGTLVRNTWESLTRPTQLLALAAATRLIEPSIDTLATAPTVDALIWKQPKRCPAHTEAIAKAEDALTTADKNTLPAATTILNNTYAAAANCDDCSGWGTNGQARQLVELAGIDVCIHIADIHRRARNHLGHTRLRIQSTMPCDACGAPKLGRDDGTWVINCTNCGAKYTENELGFLVRMKLTEIQTKEENDMLRWLLAEAYWRLDQVQGTVDTLTGDDTIALAGAGPIILDALAPALEGHPRPADRKAPA
jgi:hypothetical protein